MKEIKLDKDSFEKLIGYISDPLIDFTGFWNLLGAKFYQWTDLTFKLNGARAGHKKWAKEADYQFPSGRWAIRRGSDGRPVSKYHKGDGKWRKYRSDVKQRWTAKPMLLQVSSFFKDSFIKDNDPFNVLIKEPKKMRYGTNYEIAEQIMNVKNRQVLFITDSDKKETRDLVIDYVNKKIHENINK